MSKLILYGTLGCHLCSVAEGVLESAIDFKRFSVELVDIADDDQLVDKYGVRIPVLADSASGDELGWPFDALQLQEFIFRLYGPVDPD
ncbi:MAG: glutaredoxin family protein [Motiliproteus sp.]